MKLTYEQTFDIDSFDVDYFNRLKLSSLFNKMEIVSTRHANELGIGSDKLIEKDMVWVLARVKIEMYSYPKWQQKIKIKTWPGSLIKILVPRYYLFEDEQGNIIGKAVSLWTFLNFKERKLVVPILDHLNYPDTSHLPVVLDVPAKIHLDLDMKFMHQHIARYSDIDINEHVNNSKYIEWMTDCVDYKKYQGFIIKSIQINYLKEVLEGDKVDLFSNMDEERVVIEGRNGEVSSIVGELLFGEEVSHS